MANYIVKSADIDFGETIYIPINNVVMREAKLVKLTYKTGSLHYHFVMAGLEHEMIICEPQGNGYNPEKFYRTSDDAFKGITIPLKTINLIDKLFEAGFNLNTDCSRVVTATYKEFNLSTEYIPVSDAKFAETCDGIDVDFRQFKQVTMEGVTCYQYEDADIIVFKSAEDALKAQPIKIYKF